MQSERQMNPKPTVAVLISGQYRTFRDTWATNGALLTSDQYTVHFYLDVWKDVGATNRTLPGYQKTIGKSRFDPFVYTWSSSKVVSKSETLSVLPDAKIRIHDSVEQVFTENRTLLKLRDMAPPSIEQMFVNSVGMFYLIEQSYLHLMSSGQSYDWVIRIRPDWVLRRNIIQDLLVRHQGQDAVFFDSSPRLDSIPSGYVSDVCFAGTMSSIAMLSSTFTFWIKKLEQEGWVPHPDAAPNHFQFLVSESALSHHIRDWRADKSVAIGEARAGYILRDGIDVQPIRRLALSPESRGA